jgi:hypothetical protein
LLLEEDFSGCQLGELPAGWAAPRGTFAVRLLGGKNVLEFAPEPMVEGRVLLPGLLPNGGVVRARMHGERGRRTFPRFGLGLADEVGYKLLALPGEGQLQIVQMEKIQVNGKAVENDKILARVPWQWAADAWWWLEFSLVAEENGSRLEGRCWPEGERRPELPMLVHHRDMPMALVHASLQVAPYALKPIYTNTVNLSKF